MNCRCLTRSLLALAMSLGASMAFAADAADAPGGSACRADTKKLCPAVRPGGGRVLACLKDRQADLSPACQAALPVMQRCAQEIQSACGAGTGRRDMRSCLRSQADKISPECRGLAPQR